MDNPAETATNAPWSDSYTCLLIVGTVGQAGKFRFREEVRQSLISMLGLQQAGCCTGTGFGYLFSARRHGLQVREWQLRHLEVQAGVVGTAGTTFAGQSGQLKKR